MRFCTSVLNLAFLLRFSIATHEVSGSIQNETCACKCTDERVARSDDTDPYTAVVDQHSQEITQLKAQMQAVQTKLSQKVAFSAHFSKTLIDFTSGARMVFDTVVINIGNGYDAASGTFHAPYSGLYVFHIKVLSQDNFGCRLDIIKAPGTEIATAEVWSDHNRQVATAQSVVHLAAGQSVWVTAFITGMSPIPTSSRFYGGIYTTFDGFLLSSD